MSETYREQVRRVQMMAKGSPTWDLSDNDMAALTAVLTELDAYAMEIAELRKDKARLDWLERVGFACSNSGTIDAPRVHCWGGCSPLRWTATYISSEFTNARAAIDAAMEASR